MEEEICRMNRILQEMEDTDQLSEHGNNDDTQAASMTLCCDDICAALESTSQCRKDQKPPSHHCAAVCHLQCQKETLIEEDTRSNSTLEMMKCSDSLEKMQIRDPLSSISPGLPVQESTPDSNKKENGERLKIFGEESKNRKMATGAVNDITKPSARKGNRKNGKSAKKQVQCDSAHKQNCEPEKPQKSERQNGENISEVAASCSPEHKENSQRFPASLPTYITCVFKDKEENLPVKKDDTVIDFIQPFEATADSDNIILYSHKLEATINPYIRCSSLEEGERLEIIKKTPRKYKNSETNISKIPASNYPEYGKGTFFKVQNKGTTIGGAVRKIVYNDKWCWDMKPLAVFGLPAETICEAIMNDKRFNIKGTLSLKDPNTSVIESCDLPLSPLKTDVVYGVQIKKADPKSELPCYRTPTSERFSRDFANMRSSDRKGFRLDAIEDYTRNVIYKAMLATIHRLLAQHLDSVALIRIPPNPSGVGTFFLLTENLGLTCYHVLESQLKGLDCRDKPIINAEVVFYYEKESDQTLNCQVRAEFWDQHYDFIFLRLLESQGGAVSPPQEGAASVDKDHIYRPRGLLEYTAPPPQEGTVSIIGHPDGAIKKIDTRCSVINYKKRPEAIAATLLSDKSYFHILTQYNFQKMSRPDLVTDDTCLYWGASGSPVFDDQGGVVAMHTGGYPADTKLKKKKSVIEYGTSLVDILIFGFTHIPDLLEWFMKLPEGKLADYINKYIGVNEHSDKMQPVVRQFLQRLEENRKKNPNYIDSRIADLPIDTSDSLINISNSSMDTAE